MERNEGESEIDDRERKKSEKENNKKTLKKFQCQSKIEI